MKLCLNVPNVTRLPSAQCRTVLSDEFSSDEIDVYVGDPANEVVVEAEQLDPDIRAMQELDDEERATRQQIQAAEQYMEFVGQQTGGYEAGTSRLNDLVMQLGRSHLQFCEDVAQERLKRRYSKIVCMAAAGGELERADERFVWECAGKTEAEFKLDVEATQRASLRSFKMETDLV